MSDEIPLKKQAMAVETTTTPEEPVPLSLRDIFEPVSAFQPEEPASPSVRAALQPFSMLLEALTSDSDAANSLISGGDGTATPYENVDDSSDPGYFNDLESADADESVVNLDYAHNQMFTKYFHCKKSTSESGVVTLQQQRRDAEMEAANNVKVVVPNLMNVGVVSSCSSFPYCEEATSQVLSDNDAPRSYYSTPLPPPQPDECKDTTVCNGSSYSFMNDANVAGVVREAVTRDNHTSSSQKPHYSAQWVGRGPLHTMCPNCNELIMTVVRRYNNLQTDDNCSFNACCFCFWPCLFLPYWIPSMQDVEHSCPHCNAFLGTFRRA